MKFISRYSNNKEVSPAQYITEIICEKKAKLNKKDLHYRFWLNKEWAVFYKNQIAAANKLVKTYDPVAVVKALNDPKTSKVYSLRAPSLITTIQSHQKQVDAANSKLSVVIDRSENKKYSKNNSTTKNIISKLKDLE